MSAAKTLATVRRLLSGKPQLAVGVQVNVHNEREATGSSGAAAAAAVTQAAAADGGEQCPEGSE